MNPGHVLVFGGTGMLAKATGWMTKHATRTVVFGRNQGRLDYLMKSYNSHGLEIRNLDYTDTEALKHEIKSAYMQHGPIDMVVAWIHSTAPAAIQTIKQQISYLQGRRHWTFLHIKGSANDLTSIITSDPDNSANCHVKEVRLGFIYNGSFSRWLTNEEISDGVIQAIKEEKDITVVGTLEPWEKRP
ncbi:short-chain dehydrogenase [Salibacterium aidingense]|uniref:short-chain dehydrogenase n=1 Tax=Salibacterium aidingense TaxID=384933 RepID=UPI003BE94905